LVHFLRRNNDSSFICSNHRGINRLVESKPNIFNQLIGVLIVSKVTQQPFVYVPAAIAKEKDEIGVPIYSVQFQVQTSNIKEALDKVAEWASKRSNLSVEFGHLPPRKKPIDNRSIIVIDAKQCDCGQRQGVCVTGMGGCMTDKQPEGESA